MNKKTKKIIIAILIVISCVGLYKIIDATSYTFVRMKAEAYLCQKYDAKPSEIELVDYKHAKPYWNHDPIISELHWTDFSFEFEYNDKKFFVNRDEGKFYDDYQLDDIEQWCTEWLKENIDEKIIGINIESANIAFYQKNKKTDNYYIIKETDVEDFIKDCEKHTNDILVYYNDENVKISEHDTLREEIIFLLKKRLNTNRQFNVYFTSNKMTKSSYKKTFDNRWISMYDGLETMRNKK